MQTLSLPGREAISWLKMDRYQHLIHFWVKSFLLTYESLIQLIKSIGLACRTCKVQKYLPVKI